MSKYGLSIIFTNNKIDFDYYSITITAKNWKIHLNKLHTKKNFIKAI